MRTAELALFAWIPLCMVLFAVLRPRHAVIAAYIGAWLFLPVYGIDLPGLPPYSKVSASAYGVLFGAALFDLDRLLSFRPRWFDLPMAVMQHGLACAMWMTTSTIVGVWLWTSGALKRIGFVPMYLLVLPLLVTAVLCKSAGALILLLAGLGTFYWVKWFRNAIPLLV